MTKKCFTIRKTKTGRKYIKLRGKKIYLTTLKKKVNKKRLKKGKKPLERITSQNIENVLISVLEDVGKIKNKDTRDEFLQKIEKETKESIKKINVEKKDEANELIDDLKNIKKQVKKKKKRVKIKVIPEEIKELPETRPITPLPGDRKMTEEEKEEAKQIEKQLKNVQQTLLERIKKLQLGGMLLDKSQALDNTEIEKIMKRYKNFLGVYPRDMLYKIIPQVKEKSDGGVILNLDKNGEPGSHWVALYFNGGNDKPSIEYFDSYARPPPKEIIEDIKKIIQKLNADKHIKYKENMILNQSKDEPTVSCGYISMKFLMDRFRGISFKKATGYGVKKSENDAEKMYEKFKYITI